MPRPRATPPGSRLPYSSRSARKPARVRNEFVAPPHAGGEPLPHKDGLTRTVRMRITRQCQRGRATVPALTVEWSKIKTLEDGVRGCQGASRNAIPHGARPAWPGVHSVDMRTGNEG